MLELVDHIRCRSLDGCWRLNHCSSMDRQHHNKTLSWSQRGKRNQRDGVQTGGLLKCFSQISSVDWLVKMDNKIYGRLTP